MPNEQGPKPTIHTKKHVARLERERQQTRLILYVFSGLLIIVVGVLLYGYIDINYLQLNKPVATVGGVEITAAEFESRVQIQRKQLLDNYSQYIQFQQFMDVTQQLQEIEYYLQTPGVIGQGVLNQMINEEIVRQEAAKMGISVSPEELEKAIHSDFGYYPDGTLTPTVTPTEFATLTIPEEAFSVVTRTPTTGPTPEGTPTAELTVDPSVEITAQADGTQTVVESTATLEPTATLTATATLASTATPTTGPTSTATPTATPYTLEGFENQYATIVAGLDKFGMTNEGYRRFIEIRLLQEKIKAAVVTDVPATQTQVWARHILVADQTLAVTIIGRLNAGEDFAELAKEFSTDGSSANGGDLGWFGPGAMVAEFETAAFALKESGDITQTPVQTQFGFHIIQLIAKQDRPITAEEIEQTRDTKYNEWLAATRENYLVVIDEAFWKLREPKVPNFETLATESAETARAQQTALAEETPVP
jgi:peptidyl-prolyl cis-trans isomerase D